jgi:hypothetical protein
MQVSPGGQMLTVIVGKGSFLPTRFIGFDRPTPLPKTRLAIAIVRCPTKWNDESRQDRFVDGKKRLAVASTRAQLTLIFRQESVFIGGFISSHYIDTTTEDS